MEFMVNGFRNGFDTQYQGEMVRQSTARNLPLKEIESKAVIWNKTMKEVKNKQVAGPFNKVPFKNFIQSLIGLVPKSGGDGTRLIFHPLYDFGEGGESLNAETPRELCFVQYSDIDQAVRSIL